MQSVKISKLINILDMKPYKNAKRRELDSVFRNFVSTKKKIERRVSIPGVAKFC